jgi:hypothetical protein
MEITFSFACLPLNDYYQYVYSSEYIVDHSRIETIYLCEDE